MTIENNQFVIIEDVFRLDNGDYNEDFSVDHLTVLVALQDYYNIRRQRYEFTFGWLYEDINVSGRGITKRWVQAFKDLVEWGMIEWLNPTDKINVNTRLQVKLNEDYNHNGFTTINSELVWKILDSDMNIVVKQSCLFLTVLIESVRNNDMDYSFPSYDFLCNHTKYARTTIKSTLDTLVELEVLVYGNAGLVQSNTGEVIESNNTYVLCDKPNYKSILQRAINSRLDTILPNSTRQAGNSNKNRSKTMKMKHMQKKYLSSVLTDEEVVILTHREIEYANRVMHQYTDMSELQAKLVVVDLEYPPVIDIKLLEDIKSGK